MDNNLTNDINTSTAPAQTTVSDADITAAAFNDMMAPLTNAAPTLTLRACSAAARRRNKTGTCCQKETQQLRCSSHRKNSRS